MKTRRDRLYAITIPLRRRDVKSQPLTEDIAGSNIAQI
jgi:hypothetical protein